MQSQRSLSPPAQGGRGARDSRPGPRAVPEDGAKLRAPRVVQLAHGWAPLNPGSSAVCVQGVGSGGRHWKEPLCLDFRPSGSDRPRRCDGVCPSPVPSDRSVRRRQAFAQHSTTHSHCAQGRDPRRNSTAACPGRRPREAAWDSPRPAPAHLGPTQQDLHAHGASTPFEIHAEGRCLNCTISKCTGCPAMDTQTGHGRYPSS